VGEGSRHGTAQRFLKAFHRGDVVVCGKHDCRGEGIAPCEYARREGHGCGCVTPEWLDDKVFGRKFGQERTDRSRLVCTG
jgi:hypothetical protein